MRRLRDGEWIAGIGGLGLLAVMLTDWYSAAGVDADVGFARLDVGASAWESFSVLDVVLALLALVPLALVVLQATRDSPSLPVAFSVFTTVAGAIATLLILYRIVNQPGPNDAVEVEAGAWLGLAAAAAMAAGGWRSMRVEAMPGVPPPPVEELPAP
jgi:drug/metabolite transporter (DMT)-like permease